MAQEAEMSLTRISWLESARRYFSWTRRTSCPESRNQTFLGSGGRNESNTHQFARIGLKKFSHEFDVNDVYKLGIKRFCAQEGEMRKTAYSSLVSARKKFFMNPTYIMSRKQESNVLEPRRLKWVKLPTARSYRREKSFSWTLRTWCLESRNETFLGSGGRNESITHQFARIGLKKFSHEFDVHDVYKVAIKCFSAHEAEMSLTRMSWLESARRYFSWNWRTWCLESRNETFLGSGGRNESNTHQFARIGLKKFSHELDVRDVYKVGMKRFWAQEAKMSLTLITSHESARKSFS